MKQEGTLERGTLITLIEDLVEDRNWGYLFIFSDDHKSLLHVNQAGIVLVADSSSKWKVEDLIVQRGYVTESQMEKARSIADEANKDLKPVVNEQGFATTDQFEKAARKQAWEILLDAFLIQDADYEFRDRDRRSEVDEEYTPPFKFLFDHEEVLEEAQNRISEFETQKTLISDEHERYNVKEENLPQRSEVAQQALVDRVVDALQNANSVREILEELNFSVYEIYKTLADLSMSGALQPMSEEEVLEGAREIVEEEGDVQQSVRMYKRYLSNNPGELDVREELGQALSKAGKGEEASELLADTAKIYLEKLEKHKAHQLLKEAYENDPENEAVREIWFDTVLDLNDPKRIRKTGEELIQSYIGAGNLDDAEDVLTRLLKRFPHSVRLLMTGADLAMKQDDTAKVKMYLERSADELPENISSGTQEAVDYLKRSSNYPNELEDQIRSAVGYDDSIVSRKQVAIAALVLLVGSGLYYMVRIQWEARLRYEDVDYTAEQEIEEGNVEEAIDAYRGYIDNYPYSYKRFSARNRIYELREQLESRTGKAEETKSKDEQEKKDSDKPSGKPSPEARLAKVREQLLSSNSTPLKQFEDRLNSLKQELEDGAPEREEISELLDKIRRKQQKATSLFQEARKLADQGKLVECRNLMDELRENFSRTQAADKIFYPVKIRSFPPAVNVFIEDNQVGTTPVIHEFREIRPYTVSAVRRHFELKEFEIFPSETPEHTVVLEKKIAWELDLLSEISAQPLMLDDTLFVGTENGLVWSGNYDRLERWRGTIRKNTALEHLLSSSSGPFFALTEDGTLLSFDPSSEKTVLWEKTFSYKQLLKPVIEPATGHILLPSKSGRIYVVDSGRGIVRSTISLPSPPASPVLQVNDSLYIFTENNRLHEVDIGRSTVGDGFGLGPESDAPLEGSLITGSDLVFSTEHHRIRIADPENQNVRTVAELDSPLYPGLSKTGASIHFVTENGVLYRWNMESGQAEWKRPLPAGPATGPVADGNMVYVADKEGRVHAFHGPSGQSYWSKEIPYGIPTTGLHFHKRNLIFGTGEGFLYLIRTGTYE